MLPVTTRGSVATGRGSNQVKTPTAIVNVLHLFVSVVLHVCILCVSAVLWPTDLKTTLSTEVI